MKDVILQSPRTTQRFRISHVGVETAAELTWQGNDAEFAKMARLCLGLPIDGPPPFWHLLELCQIILENNQPQTAHTVLESNQPTPEPTR